MCFVYQHKNIISLSKKRILLTHWRTELVNQREDKRLVALKESTKLLAVLRPTLILRPDDLCTDKILVYLLVKILSVRDDEEREIPLNLTPNLTDKHYHREGLSRALSMPKYTQLSSKLLPIIYRLHQVIDTEVLMILGNNLYRLILEQNKILYIVQQTLLI